MTASPSRSDRDSAIRALRYWLCDPDLKGLRDEDALAQLPAEERERWHALWAEVRELLGQVQEAHPPSS